MLYESHKLIMLNERKHHEGELIGAQISYTMQIIEKFHPIIEDITLSIARIEDAQIKQNVVNKLAAMLALLQDNIQECQRLIKEKEQQL